MKKSVNLVTQPKFIEKTPLELTFAISEAKSMHLRHEFEMSFCSFDPIFEISMQKTRSLIVALNSLNAFFYLVHILRVNAASAPHGRSSHVLRSC